MKMLVANDKEQLCLMLHPGYGFDLTLFLCLHFSGIQAADSFCLGYTIVWQIEKRDGGTI